MKRVTKTRNQNNANNTPLVKSVFGTPSGDHVTDNNPITPDLLSGDISRDHRIYGASVMEGSPALHGDSLYFTGNPTLTGNDVQDIYEGEPGLISTIAADKIGEGISSNNPNVEKSAKIATLAQMSIPGSAISALRLPPVINKNCVVRTFGTTAVLSGDALRTNIAKWRSEYPILSLEKQVVGADDLTAKSVVLGSAEATTLGFPNGKIAIPFFYIAITAPVDSVRMGARYQIELEATSENGQELANDKFTIEWDKTGVFPSCVIVPYLRVKETLLPMLAAFGRENAVDVEITVTITGLAAKESMRLIVPGFDSQETAEFLQKFNISFN